MTEQEVIQLIKWVIGGVALWLAYAIGQIQAEERRHD